jgi:hypothetical protein
MKKLVKLNLTRPEKPVLTLEQKAKKLAKIAEGMMKEGAEEPDGAAPSVSALTALVGQLNAKIEAMQKAPPAAQASQPWTPERWAKLEEDTGLKEPAVKFLFGEMIKPLMDNITGKYEGRLARIERDYVINDLAGKKGFEDIRAHMDGINEFLKNFDPRPGVGPGRDQDGPGVRARPESQRERAESGQHPRSGQAHRGPGQENERRAVRQRRAPRQAQPDGEASGQARKHVRTRILEREIRQERPEMNRVKYAPHGTPVYPSPTAGRGERLGRTPWRRCRQCGCPNDTRTTAWASAGDGLVEDSDSPADRTVTAGCRFCGSLQWLTNKPRPIEDRSLELPFKGWRRKKVRW